VLMNDADIAVQDTSLFVLDNSSGVHDVLIRLGNHSNQEVNQNNKDEELIEKPKGVDDIHGDCSCIGNELILACLMAVPVSC